MEFYIAKSWSDINVKTFIELTNIKLENYNSEEEYNVDVISTLSDLTREEIENMNYNQYEEILLNLNFLKRLPSSKFSQSLLVNSKRLDFIGDFNNLSVGEFIDLEHYFGNNYYQNLPIILAILYRFKINRDEWYPDKIEEYGDYIYHRGPLFNTVNINQVYGVIDAYINWRTQIFETYEGLFDSTVDDEEPYDDLSNQNIVAKAEAVKEEKKQKAIKKWGWYIFLLRLSNNDITKLDDVVKVNIIQALNILSCKKELEID